MSPAWKFLALAAISCCCSYASAAGRLSEREITLPVFRAGPDGVAQGVPVVDPPKRIAGYFKLNRKHDARMFYFYFQARTNTAGAPLVLWMTGGPGCSSEIAILYENGPYSIDKATMELVETKYGWDVTHNMLFVDQPIGTGFSYSKDSRDRVYNEKGVADDMLDFLYEFYAAHPELADSDFYVTGESYAGHYVPAVSARVYRANELGQGPLYIPLKGLAIGNGLTAPAVQFPAYADFALQNNLIGKGLHDRILFFMPLCRWGAEFCDAHDWRLACIVALQVCQLIGFEPILAANPNINVYDITKTCDGPLCYDMSAADEYLNRPDVREALGVGDREWSECNFDVHGDMMGDWLKSYDGLLPQMLEDGIRVMVYAGDLDLICNWVGNERWVQALEWEQADAWRNTTAQEWTVGGAAAGTVREHGPLSFVRVYKAGHMVPMDQPANALAMITRFTRGKNLLQDEGAEGEGEGVQGVEGGGKEGKKVAGARDVRVKEATFRGDKHGVQQERGPREGVRVVQQGKGGNVLREALGRHQVREEAQE